MSCSSAETFVMVETTWASVARLSQRANVEHAQTERETTITVDSRGTLQDAEETAQTELRPHREIFERQLFPKNRGRVARFQMLRCHSHTVSSGLLRPFLPWPSNRSPDSLFQLYGSLGGGSTHCPAAGGAVRGAQCCSTGRSLRHPCLHSLEVSRFRLPGFARRPTPASQHLTSPHSSIGSQAKEWS